jgi:hypothetical protein
LNWTIDSEQRGYMVAQEAGRYLLSDPSEKK